MKHLKILTIGTFDLLHIGHINLFQQIKKIFPKSTLVVGLNTDEFIERFKGRKPVFSFEERKKLLDLLELIDCVVPNIGDEDSKILISQEFPHVIAIGNDWLNKDYCKQMNFTPEWLRERRISVIYIPYTDIISSSEIKKRLKSE